MRGISDRKSPHSSRGRKTTAEWHLREQPLCCGGLTVRYLLSLFVNIASTRAAESSTRFAAASARPAAASARPAAASARLAEELACWAATVQVSLISGCLAAHPRLTIVNSIPAAIPVIIRPEVRIVFTPFLSMLGVYIAIIMPPFPLDCRFIFSCPG